MLQAVRVLWVRVFFLPNARMRMCVQYFAADMKNKEFTFSGPRTLENLRRFVYDSSSFDLTAEEAKPLGEGAPDIE